MKKFPAFLLTLFYASFAYGDYITTNVTGGCGDDYVFAAMFEPNSHTCLNGYYLPANTDQCNACLSGYNCSGGTYLFNENQNQGISYKNPIVENVIYGCSDDLVGGGILNANFEPNSHDCSSGYYLPANTDECTICPVNNICVGGTYSFNETTDQGIQSCASGTFAPSGSAVCYPHILHVGNDNIYLRSEKLTTPSLNVKIGNDIFYANMSPIRTKMNKDSSRYFRARWGNNDYYICDDTTCPQ